MAYDWRSEALAKGVDQNNPQALAAAGINTGASSGGGYSSGGGGGMNAVQSALDFTRQANAPAVSTLQGGVGNLKSRYDDLIKSIKGNQETATNSATLSASNELAKRGILPDSSLFGQEVNKAVNPVLSQYSNILANTGVQEANDTNPLLSAIAQLQTGNPQGALSYGQSQNQLDQQAAQNAASNALQKMSIGISGGNLALARDRFEFDKSQNDPALLQKFFSQFGIGGNPSVAPKVGANVNGGFDYTKYLK